jgi:hypothetical protein
MNDALRVLEAVGSGLQPQCPLLADFVAEVRCKLLRSVIPSL